MFYEVAQYTCSNFTVMEIENQVNLHSYTASQTCLYLAQRTFILMQISCDTRTEFST